jgi:hypothetical protein
MFAILGKHAGIIGAAIGDDIAGGKLGGVHWKDPLRPSSLA